MAELTRRYVVMTMASELSFDAHDTDGVFVLKPWKDPAALRALEAYRDNCYPELARDLDAWISIIASGPAVRGDVGRRNDPHLRSLAPAPAAPVSARRSVAKPRRAAASRTKSARGAVTKRKKRAR
jgi:hypothetical protein